MTNDNNNENPFQSEQELAGGPVEAGAGSDEGGQGEEGIEEETDAGSLHNSDVHGGESSEEHGDGADGNTDEGGCLPGSEGGSKPPLIAGTEEEDPFGPDITEEEAALKKNCEDVTQVEDVTAEEDQSDAEFEKELKRAVDEGELLYLGISQKKATRGEHLYHIKALEDSVTKSRLKEMFDQ